MKKVSTVLAAALIALPILAEQKMPTPTPAASRGKHIAYGEEPRGRPTVTPGNTREVALSGPDTAARGKTAIQNIRARVIAVSGTTLTVLAGNGQELTFSTAKWKGPALNAKVGDIVDIAYTQTPGGPLEATTVNTTRSNTFKVGGTDANGTATPGPVDNSKIKSTKSNTSERDVANTTPTAGPVESTTVNTTKSNSYREGQPAVTPAPAESINLNSSRSNRVVQQAQRMPTLTGRVLSQQGRTFTVLINGKAITFSGAKLQALPKVGATVDIESTRTPDGQLEATRTIDLYLKQK